MPASCQLRARLVKHGRILDTGWTGALAAAAQEAVVKMTDEPVIRPEKTARDALQQGNSAARRLRLIPVEPVGRTVRKTETALDTLVCLLLYGGSVHALVTLAVS